MRNPEVRNQQAELARQFGIEGFAYYHYWFNGKRLLERPFNEVLNSGEPDFPFCLFWANETWSRRWLGQEVDILIKQEYSKEDDTSHAIYLAKAFADKRYITKEGRPLFIIYRPNDLPNVSRTIDVIKETALKENGIEPFVVGSNSHCPYSHDLLGKGFDAVLNFRPQLGVLPHAFDDSFIKKRLIKNIRNSNAFSGSYKIYDYEEALGLMEKIEPKTFDNMLPTVFVGWDNTARRGEKGIIIHNNYPSLFEKELLRVKNKLMKADKNVGFVFINAWNEWAEGNYLEPDSLNGHAYLQAVKNVFTD